MRWISTLILLSGMALGQATFIQVGTKDHGINGTNTDTVALTGVGTNHLIVLGVEACVPICQGIGTAASVVSVSSSLGLTYTNALFQTFFFGGTRSFTNSLWYTFTGPTSGNETATVTWSSATGGGLILAEYDLGTTVLLLDGTPIQAQGMFPGGGSPPTYTAGNITTTRPYSLLVVVADANNGTFTNSPAQPAGWISRASAIGQDLSLVDSTTNAAVPGVYAGVATSSVTGPSSWGLQYIAFITQPTRGRPRSQVY